MLKKLISSCIFKIISKFIPKIIKKTKFIKNIKFKIRLIGIIEWFDNEFNSNIHNLHLANIEEITKKYNDIYKTNYPDIYIQSKVVNLIDDNIIDLREKILGKVNTNTFYINEIPFLYKVLRYILSI